MTMQNMFRSHQHSFSFMSVGKAKGLLLMETIKHCNILT